MASARVANKFGTALILFVVVQTGCTPMTRTLHLSKSSYDEWLDEDEAVPAWDWLCREGFLLPGHKPESFEGQGDWVEVAVADRRTTHRARGAVAVTFGLASMIVGARAAAQFSEDMADAGDAVGAAPLIGTTLIGVLLAGGAASFAGGTVYGVRGRRFDRVFDRGESAGVRNAPTCR